MLTEQEEQFLDAIYAKYAQTLLRCSQSICSNSRTPARWRKSAYRKPL